MESNKFRRLFSFVLIVILVPNLLLAVSSCTPGDVQTLEGILQNIDEVDGDITIQTKDGKTVTLKIDTDASVQTEDGAASSIESLEPGSFVEIEKEKDKED